MEYLFSNLKKMDVISIADGKNLGRIFDVAFTLPENSLKGFFVTGCKGIRLTRSDTFIPVSDIVRVGEDVVLVRTGKDKCRKEPPPRDCRRPCPDGAFSPDPRRDFGEYE